MRTIIVGDVHGCRAELEALLLRVGFRSGDRLVFVGDLVARGPDSLGVLDIARRSGAVVVRGNHEQRLLDSRNTRLNRVPLGLTHTELKVSLRPVDWTILATSKLFVDLPDHGVRIVHAGVAPGVAIEAQAPLTLMNIRTVRVEAREVGGQRFDAANVLWGSTYIGPPQIVFGHNAAPGLQVHAWATGLDTGCVYGGSLTAMVLQHGQKVPREIRARRALLVSEPAQRVWFAPVIPRVARTSATVLPVDST